MRRWPASQKKSNLQNRTRPHTMSSVRTKRQKKDVMTPVEPPPTLLMPPPTIWIWRRRLPQPQLIHRPGQMWPIPFIGRRHQSNLSRSCLWWPVPSLIWRERRLNLSRRSDLMLPVPLATSMEKVSVESEPPLSVAARAPLINTERASVEPKPLPVSVAAHAPNNARPPSPPLSPCTTPRNTRPVMII